MVALAVAAGLFPPEAAPFLAGQAEAWLAGGRSSGAWVVAEADGKVACVAFYEPRAATDRVWALTMIVVDPSIQGTGMGGRVLRWVEQRLRDDGQRLLVIETSSTPAYDKTRRFYERNGYRSVATVPDYYEDGDHMVLYYKRLV
jgi:GNAT superfamily N-acetyltransferase